MNKLYLPLMFLVIASACLAQPKRKAPKFNSTKPNGQNQFLDKQWWLGFKAGTNLSQADVMKRYTILTPTNYGSNQIDKTYDAFNVFGIVTSVEASFSYKGFSFSLQPTYRSSHFTYSNQLRWFSTTNNNESLTQNFSQEQKIEFAEIPFSIKYDVYGDRLRPFVQVGIYYSMLINAVKTVQVSGTDIASGGTNQLSTEPVIVGTKDLFTNNWGLIGGFGVTYQTGNVRWILDATYRMGMSNIVNTKNRFANDRLSGIGDAQDDLKLNNIVITAGVLFPLRFLSNDFKSN